MSEPTTAAGRALTSDELHAIRMRSADCQGVIRHATGSDPVMDRAALLVHIEALAIEAEAHQQNSALRRAFVALNLAMDKIRDGDSPEGDLLECHAVLDSALAFDCGCDWDSRNSAGCSHVAPAVAALVPPPLHPTFIPPSAPPALHQHDIDSGPCDCDQPPSDIERWYAAEYARLSQPDPEPERRHDPTDHDCRGGVEGDRFPL